MPRSIDALLRDLSVNEPSEHVQLEMWPTAPLPQPRGYDPLARFASPITIPSWGINEWEEEASEKVRVQRWPAELQPQSDAVTREVLDRLSPSLGVASLIYLEDELECAMHWAVNNYDRERGAFVPFARAVANTVWRRFKRRFGWRNLRLEKDDETRRNAALMNEAAVAPYLKRILTFMQQWLAWRHRRPIAVIKSDHRAQDQVFAVVARVLELLRSDSPAQVFAPYLRVGQPSFFAIRDRVLYEQRRKERIRLVEVPAEFVQGRTLGPLAAMCRRETDASLDEVYQSLRVHLRARHRRYLDAIFIELQHGPVWGVQQRAAKYLSCSKSRVSEAVAEMREVARTNGLEDLLHLDEHEL